VPGELAIKCRKLIESYHAMYGYVGLPDMLWLSDARDIIECHPDLAQTFKRASKSRGAKTANESFLLIATIIVSIEVLAHDFASWGTRFPTAQREAEKLLGDFPLRQRNWLMDLYMYPPLGIRREFANALAPGGARRNKELEQHASDKQSIGIVMSVTFLAYRGSSRSRFGRTGPTGRSSRSPHRQLHDVVQTDRRFRKKTCSWSGPEAARFTCAGEASQVCKRCAR